MPLKIWKVKQWTILGIKEGLKKLREIPTTYLSLTLVQPRMTQAGADPRLAEGSSEMEPAKEVFIDTEEV